MSLPGHIDLNQLRVFCSVAEAKGFSAAADRLGIAKAKVSILVQRLEADLGTSLFIRTTRRVSLTAAGEALYAECQPLLAQLLAAADRAGNDSAELSGALRLTTSVDHAIQWLSPALAQFSRMHPQLQIDLRSTDRVVDMVAEGIDLAIRLGWLPNSSLRAIKLGEFGQYVVASPQYLRERGTPKQPPDLVDHDWVTLTLLNAPLTWQFADRAGGTQTVQMRSRMRVDSPGTMRALLCAGAGISAIDGYSVRDDLATGRLVRVLADWELPRGGVYAVFPPGQHVPARTRAFVDFYREILAKSV
jgi:DNA-binding transcriptional LysR family regulator